MCELGGLRDGANGGGGLTPTKRMCPEFTLQTSSILPSKISQFDSSGSPILPSPSQPCKWIQMVIPIFGRCVC